MLRDSSIKHVIAYNIKKYRNQNGITQRELADIIGTSNTNISNWEKEVSSPDMDTLHNIAAALGVTMYELVSDDDSSAKDYDKASNGFYTEIADLCKRNGITVEELCEKINIPFKVYQNYAKNNSGRLSIDIIRDIGQVLGVPLDYFERREDKPLFQPGGQKTSTKNCGLELTKNEIKLIESYRSQPHLQEAVEKVLGVYEESVNIAARKGQKEMKLTQAQRKALGEVVEQSKGDDNSDLI